MVRNNYPTRATKAAAVILVDYRCPTCGGIDESAVQVPAPAQRPCSSCGQLASRLYDFAGLATRRPDASTPQVAPAPSPRPTEIPGTCSMHPAVVPVWSARVRGDERALARAVTNQERYLDRTGMDRDALARNSPARQGLKVG